MNTRGVFFTFLTFLLIGSIMVLLAFYFSVTERAPQTTIELSALNAINAKYDDITDDIITLDHPIGIPSITQRILPFQHTVDGKNFTVTQTLPIPSGKLNLYYDIINAYRLFVRDQNTQRTFDGVTVDLDVPRSPAWGGTTTAARFNLLPQCIQYQLIDDNHTALESTSTIGCQNPFGLYAQIQRIDINISPLSEVDDFNVVTCDFNGSICPHEIFASDANNPFFTITFLDTNCTNCALSSNDKSIAGYFTPDWNFIQYTCSGTNCVSTLLEIQIGNGIRFQHGLTLTQISMHVQFREPISTFYYQDANYVVSKPGFDTIKSNVVVFPQ